MWNARVTIPLQIVCQLLVPGQNGTGNAPFAVDTPLPETTGVQLPDYALKTSKPTRVLPEGYTAFPDIGVAYKYYTENLTWNSARKTCIADGGALADVDTFEKIKYVTRLKNTTEKHGLAVGFHRLFDNVEWTSLRTGQQLTMIPWGATSDDDMPEYRCLYTLINGTGLTADRCSAQYRFICEIPLPVDWK